MKHSMYLFVSLFDSLSFMQCSRFCPPNAMGGRRRALPSSFLHIIISKIYFNPSINHPINQSNYLSVCFFCLCMNPDPTMGGEVLRPPPQPPPTFFICLMMIQKMYTCIHPSLIQLWKATIPCLPDCNCDLKSIPAPHLDEQYSAKNNHPCFPPPHLHQHYIVQSDRKRPPLALTFAPVLQCEKATMAISWVLTKIRMDSLLLFFLIFLIFSWSSKF